MKRGMASADPSAEQAKRSKNIFQTRCNPKLNFQIIERFKSNPEFRKVLTEVRLEGLLQLRITRLDRQLCADLASRLDCENSLLKVHGKEIPLNYPTVTRVLGLPCIGTGIPATKDMPTDAVGKASERFNLDSSGRISVYSLLSFLEGSTSFNEEFKAKVLLFTIASMLRPTSNVHVHFREFIPLLNDMNKFKNFNWAKFVLDGLLYSVRAFQSNGAKSLGGCLLYLQVLYLHCISPVSWEVHDPCFIATPCLSNWTNERANVIVRIMHEQGGIDSEKVPVRTDGLPVNKVDHVSTLPQLLLHEISIQRIHSRQDDGDDELSKLRQDFMKLCHLLKLSINSVRDVSISI